MSLFVKLGKVTRTPQLKVRLASTMGLLIRHATLITHDLESQGLLAVLCAMVQDKHELLRRKATATLGELLFYIATQQQQQNGATTEALTAEWSVPSGVFGVLTRCLRQGEDEVVQHCASCVLAVARDSDFSMAAKIFCAQTVVLRRRGCSDMCSCNRCRQSSGKHRYGPIRCVCCQARYAGYYRCTAHTPRSGVLRAAASYCNIGSGTPSATPTCARSASIGAAWCALSSRSAPARAQARERWHRRLLR